MLDELIGAVATGHGFRASDYTAVWDGKELDADREPHELTIVIKDCSQVAVKSARRRSAIRGARFV